METEQKPDWSTRQSSCCGKINMNTDSDLCPDCKDHTSFEYYDAEGNLLFEE